MHVVYLISEMSEDRETKEVKTNEGQGREGKGSGGLL